ncbi:MULTISPECIES: condensation domain-containing protein [unclassified Streptomyces]|uniref:condensation domain-containing protein n=1 Tax=unclassified Streptomyces TaxID=2593676 RepID=UPI000938CCF6|nr:condensation domain-containing protein [Streptomyces sp. CB02058]
MSQSLVDLLRNRAEDGPGATAFRFLNDDESATEVSCAGLDRAARSVAAALQERGAVPGDRTLLLYPPGPAYLSAFFGSLYAGTVPVPAYPPRSLRNVDRLTAVAEDSRAAFALTTADILPLLEAGAEGLGLRDARALATDTLPDEAADAWRSHAPAADAPAFLQYTSGSTATPKGVVLTHAQLLHNLGMISESFGCDPETRGVIWLPPYHDMGLIGGILTPLSVGFPVTLMSPMSFLRSPARWLRTISRERAHMSGGPNFAYEMCVRSVTEQEKAELDLSSWRVAFNGAEPIRARTLDAFSEAFAACGFRRSAFLPCYGLAEATLYVTGARAADEPSVLPVDPAPLEKGLVQAPAPGTAGRLLVGSGRPLDGQEVLVVDPDARTALADRAVGEIWTRGASTASGYWDNARATREVFGATLADTGEGPYLRTGDLGFLADGELFVTGRRKDLIIVRGRNFYPTDIEVTVEQAHPSFRTGCGAAIAVEEDGTTALVVLQEVEGRAIATLDSEAAVAAVRAAVAQTYDLAVREVVLLKPGSIPKTTSGKVQRGQCRQTYAAGEFANLWTGADEAPAELPDAAALATLEPAERTAVITRYLREQVAQVLGTGARAVDPAASLLSLGIDSLGAVRIANRARRDLAVVVPPARILDGADIESLAARAEAAPADTDGAPDTGPGAAELSYGQLSLWHVQAQDPASAAYNIPVALTLRGPFDRDAFDRALARVVRRHEVLSSRYEAADGSVRAVHGRPVAGTRYTDASAWDDEQLADRLRELAHQPFDLEREAVLRTHVLSRSDQEQVLLLVVHHIAADLWTVVLLMDELGRDYREESEGTPAGLPSRAPRYSDFAREQRRMLAGPAGQELEEYWRDRLDGPLPVLDLPLDGDRPQQMTYRGGRRPFTVGREETAALRAFARKEGVTLYTLMLCAFEILLHHASGQDTVLVGSPAANRGREDAERVAGYFTNPVVLTSRLAPDTTSRALLAQTHTTVLDALGHQAYPFPLLVEKIRPERDPSRSPVFQTLFTFQKPQDHPEAAAFVLGASDTTVPWSDALSVSPLQVRRTTAQYELALEVVDLGGELHACLEYNSDLFAEATAERLAAHYRDLLSSVRTGADVPVAQLCPADLTERRSAARRPAPEVLGLSGYEPPETETERILAGIWADVLDVDRVGAEDDFYDLGGHSLLVTQLIGAVKEEFGVDLPVRAVMRSRTVRQGSAYIDALVWARQSAAPATANDGREEGEL